MLKVYVLNKDLPHLGLKKGQSAKLSTLSAEYYGLEDEPVKTIKPKKADTTSEEVENGISNKNSE